MQNNTISHFIASHFDSIKAPFMRALDSAASYAPRGDIQILIPLAQYTFNTQSTTKGMLRLVRDTVEQGAIEHLALIRVCSQAKINTDSSIQAAKSFSGKLHAAGVNQLRVKDIKALLKHYPEPRVMKLLWAHDGEALADTFSMMSRIASAHPNLQYLPKKPKSITQIHDVCVRTMPKVGQQDFDLEQREDILQLDGKPVMDDLVIRVPKRHFDLVDLGESLRFCIGNGGYSREVKSKKCSIIGVFDKKGARYGVQFTRYNIQQAHGFGNLREHKPTPELLKALQELLTSKPKLPSDFLPITDSGWIQGYRYNDKDLYLLLNNIVYIYFDVPHDVYEALLDSDRKGRFVNQHIKPDYAYERLGDIGMMDIEVA
jgi:hypothetical protein